MKPEIIGSVTDGELELDERQYLPGVKIKGECPRCECAFTRDLGHHYLSYPTVGSTASVYGRCTCDGTYKHNCYEGITVEVVLRLTIELAE